MAHADYYELCCRHHGRVVRINDRHGNTHTGRITRVTRSKVYIDPVGQRRNLGGFGYGFYGYGPYGYGGYGYGIALGAITGLALAGLFFW